MREKNVRKHKAVPQITTHFDLWRLVTVWDWEGAETWEEVGGVMVVDYVGRFGSIEEIIAYVEAVSIDGLYKWARFECPLNDQQEFAHAEWFEGHWN